MRGSAVRARNRTRCHGPGRAAHEVVADALAAIATYDGELCAFTGVDSGLALAAAAEVDRRIASGAQLPLAGVPVAVKELVGVAGLPQGYGTTAMPRFVAARDAECVRRLRRAGAVPLGVTRTSELAWRDDTPPTQNPLDARLSCGGSSGGSAAAVAAGLVPLALGTDTGGSIRHPAALCGCCGHKPTADAVPLDGVLRVSPSLDHVGPLAGSVADLKLALAALTGRMSSQEAQSPDASGFRLGVPREPASLVADPALEVRISALQQALAASGAELVPVTLPSLDAAYAVVQTISLAEGAHIFAGALASPRGALSDVSRAELETAPAPDSDVFLRARQMLAVIGSQMQLLLAEHALDAVVLPALPIPAPRRGAPPGARRVGALLTLANVTGQPACVVPLRRRPSPLAVQLLGWPGRDVELLALAAIVETLAGEI
jgi:Asp-tRNA(Asn)/Glu-tRNA(Gln) amidotransferase A subunit family amidase